MLLLYTGVVHHRAGQGEGTDRVGAGGAEGGGAGGEGRAGGEDIVDEDDAGRRWCG